MIKLAAFSDEASNDLLKQIEALKRNNIHYMEIRNVNGKNIADFTDEEALSVYNTLKENDIEVFSLGSPLGKVDINTEEKVIMDRATRLCELAKIFNCKNIRMFSFYNAFDNKELVFKYLNQMVEIGKKYDVNMCHENEKKVYGDIASRVKEILYNVKDLKQVYDVANYIQCEEDPTNSLNMLHSSVYYFHIKDALLKDGSVVRAGTGDGMVKKLIEMISDDKVLTIEPHLKVFKGYETIDETKLLNKEAFLTNDEAFDAAVSATKKLLKECGYVEVGNEFIKNPVRFGIIGLGNQGSYYALKSFKQNKVEGGIITAMCDINPKKIEHMKEAYQDDSVVYFENYIDMLDSGLIDAVLVETPHYDHPLMVIDALKRKINVICDKPAGVYTKQVKEANKIAKESDVLYTMMFNQRTNCLYRKAKEMIKEGKLGKLIRVNWIITNWFRTEKYYKSGSWRASWLGEGGGVLINQCPHQIDLLSWIIGKMPSSVSSICRYGMYHNIEVEDDVTAILEYDDGATGVFVCSTGEAPGTNRLEIAGTKGKLLVENNKLVFYENEVDSLEYSKTTDESFKAPSCIVSEVETDGLNLQHAGIINNFIKAIKKEEPLFVNGIEGINGVELMNAMELSGFKNGAKVNIPLDEDEYLNYLNEKRKNSKLLNPENDSVEDNKSSFNNGK